MGIRAAGMLSVYRYDVKRSVSCLKMGLSVVESGTGVNRGDRAPREPCVFASSSADVRCIGWRVTEHRRAECSRWRSPFPRAEWVPVALPEPLT